MTVAGSTQRPGREAAEAPASRHTLSRRGKIRRGQLEQAIEAALAALDALDGDTDLEAVSEDEGGACDDEGIDADREPDHEDGPAGTYHPEDQRRLAVAQFFGETRFQDVG